MLYYLGELALTLAAKIFEIVSREVTKRLLIRYITIGAITFMVVIAIGLYLQEREIQNICNKIPEGNQLIIVTE